MLCSSTEEICIFQWKRMPHTQSDCEPYTLPHSVCHWLFVAWRELCMPCALWHYHNTIRMYTYCLTCIVAHYFITYVHFFNSGDRGIKMGMENMLPVSFLCAFAMMHHKIQVVIQTGQHSS